MNKTKKKEKKKTKILQPLFWTRSATFPFEMADDHFLRHRLAYFGAAVCQ